MCVIKEICKIFYDSTQIPISAIDEGNPIFCIGHSDDSIALINTLDLDSFLYNSNSGCRCTKIKGISDKLVVFFKGNMNNGTEIYFVIGPINISGTLEFTNSLCRSKECVGYLIKFLILIHDSIIKEYSNKYSPCVKETIEYIHQNYDKNININNICSSINMSKSYLCSIFKKETGNSIITCLNLYRIEKSKHLLKNTSNSVLHIALSIGYQSQSYFCRIFKKYVGISPMEYRFMRNKNSLP